MPPWGYRTNGMAWPNGEDVERHRLHLEMSVEDLYLRYLALTGTATQHEVEGYLGGDNPMLDPREHDVLVLAVNEAYLELGRPERLDP